MKNLYRSNDLRHVGSRATFFLVLFTAVLICAVRNQQALGQWSHDPAANTPISTAADDQSSAVITSDGSGGAIIAWHDRRNGANFDIYAQRVNASGVVQWTADGVPISTAVNDQYNPVSVSDGAGGVIIAWPDLRGGLNYDIYAQRINASGTVLWTTDGVPISTAAGNQSNPTIASDGSGGAIITWADLRSGANFDIYAQRINATGIVQWTPNGVPISTAANYQYNPTITNDGAGGAIITWYDVRGGVNTDIYAQRVNATGVRQWIVSGDSNGVAISIAANDQTNPVITGDGSGGAIITWSDSRNGTSDIYAQRINASGLVQWTANGAAISQASGIQNYPTLTSDGSGGAIITWPDYRGSAGDIYAQRINAGGAVQWTGNGVPICTAVDYQYYPTITSDGSGGAIITWYDARSGSTDIYAQRINSSGAVQWTGDGRPISTAANGQFGSTITSDGSGGAIIAWTDSRSGAGYDVYAQKVDRIGSLGKNEPILTAVRDVPGDQGGKVSVGWNRSSYDEIPNQVVTYYSIWRGAELPPSNPSARPITGTEITQNFSGKAYRVIETTAGSTYWEWIGNVTSHYFANYAFTSPTLADSGPTGAHTEKFLVSAQTSSQFVFWDSNIDSAHSVDNLPPGAVPSLVAQLQAGPSVALHWPPDKIDPDVGYYEVHRSTSPNFPPTPTTRIGLTSDTASLDNTPVLGTTNYYRIVTVDTHGNSSPPSPQASAAVQTTQQYSLIDKWNMVSVPLTVNNYGKASLFPSAISNAFAYEGSYVVKPSLANGAGYWLRFNGSQTVSMAGYLRSRDTVNVSTGWNMIGSISQSVPVDQVTSIPGGISTSHFFGYQGTYVVAIAIDAGQGYWVKVNQDGKLILSTSAAEATHRIRIVPTGEAPPPAPDGSGIEIAGVPNKYALAQNYPNPFNPVTTITYQLPIDGHISLKVFDMLGREIAALVEGEKNAGTYHVTWDAAAAPSGVYYYVLRAGSYNQVRKMVLAK